MDGTVEHPELWGKKLTSSPIVSRNFLPLVTVPVSKLVTPLPLLSLLRNPSMQTPLFHKSHRICLRRHISTSRLGWLRPWVVSTFHEP